MVKDKKIRIYKRVTGQDDYGEPIDKYVEVATTWAYYRQLSGQERFTALMVQAQEEALFVIGWRNDVTTIC